MPRLTKYQKHLLRRAAEIMDRGEVHYSCSAIGRAAGLSEHRRTLKRDYCEFYQQPPYIGWSFNGDADRVIALLLFREAAGDV